jgi:hypothetical protein
MRKFNNFYKQREFFYLRKCEKLNENTYIMTDKGIEY